MSKYTDMMREQEYVGYRLAEHGQGSSTRAHGDKCATDWRAMREAWEAMVVALDSSTAVLTQPNVGCYAQAAVNDAALTKARVE